MDGGRTTKRHYSEYSDFFSTQRESEYDQDTDRPQRESIQVRRDGREGRREPDSGLGHTQDYRTRYTDDDWTFTQRTEQPAGHKRRAGARPAVNHIPEEMGVHRDSRWDSPRKRALFTSDGPDSTTSGSDIPEGHTDRPPEIEYSERLTSAKRQDEGGTERLCSPNIKLKMTVIQLQRDVDECRTELELARKQTPAVTFRPQRRSGFTRVDAGFKILREVELGTVPRGVRGHCMFEWLGRCHGGPTAALSSGCTQRGFAGSGVSKGGARIFDKIVIGSLQCSGASGRIQVSVSAGVSASGG